MKKYVSLFLIALLSIGATRASDLLAGIENIDAQFFKQAVSTDNSIIEKELVTESLNEDSDSSSRPEDSDSDDDDDDFPPDEYEEYMDFIAKIDHSAYERLRIYEALSPTHQALLKSCTTQIISPEEKDPIILMHSMRNLTKEKKIEELTKIIKRYNDLVDALPVPFPEDEYNHYMELIKKLNEPAYDELRACEKELGKPCLLRGKDTKRIFSSEKTHGYPILIMTSLRNFPSIKKDNYLKTYVKGYKRIPPITNEERAKVLEVIKKLALELYEKMIAIDPTGEHHITRGDTITAIAPSCKDGLPYLAITSETTESTDDQLTWTIGHELTHYVNDDFDTSSPVHKAMQGNEKTSKEYTPGKKISGQLPFEETLKNAKSRAQEYKADEESVLRFGASIDAGLSNLDRWAQNEFYDHPAKETFKNTHPHSSFGRKEHLESLRAEVERRKTSGQKTQPINWDALIEKYKKGSWEEMQETL